MSLHRCNPSRPARRREDGSPISGADQLAGGAGCALQGVLEVRAPRRCACVHPGFGLGARAPLNGVLSPGGLGEAQQAPTHADRVRDQETEPMRRLLAILEWHPRGSFASDTAVVEASGVRILRPVVRTA